MNSIKLFRMLIDDQSCKIGVMFNHQNPYSWPKAATKQLGFRFSPGCFKDLEELSELYGLTKTDVLERIIYFVSNSSITQVEFVALMRMSKAEFLSLSLN